MSTPNLKRSLSELCDTISRVSPKKDKSYGKNQRTRTKGSSTAVRILPRNERTLRSGFSVAQSKDEDTKHLQWYDRFAPTRVEDLALHKKKLEEVRDQLESMISGKSPERVLLLSGPAGCSKSTCIKLLCDDLVPRYRTDSGMTVSGRKVANFIEYSSTSAEISPMESFNDFLLQSKYLVGNNLSVLIVEDLPNLFHEPTLRRFRESILSWLLADEQLPILVICLTECQLPESNSNGFSYGIDTTFVAETVLGKDILSHPLFHRIKFNPTNATLMKRHLKLILQKVRREIPEQKYVKGLEYINILASTTGDIRSGISALQFWCTSSFDGENTLFTRHRSTSYFHAIGKIIYGSKESENDVEMTNDLIDDGMVSNETLKLGVLENYSKFNKSNFPLSSALDIVEVLSLSDTLKQLDDEPLHYSIGSVRQTFRNIKVSEHGVHGQANYPREYKMVQEQKKFNLQIQDFKEVEFFKYLSLWSTKDSVLLGSYYGPSIRKLISFKAKSLNYYIKSLQPGTNAYQNALRRYQQLPMIDEVDIVERIGGEMKSMSATSDLSAGINDAIDDNAFISKHNRRRQKLQHLKDELFLQKNTSSVSNTEEFEQDPIVDSDNDNTMDMGIEDGDSELFEILSQKKPKQLKLPVTGTGGTQGSSIEDVILSDSDIENL